jgi:uncharacterized membrane protein YkgB
MSIYNTREVTCFNLDFNIILDLVPEWVKVWGGFISLIISIITVGLLIAKPYFLDLNYE